MSLVRANNPAFPALLPKPVPGLFCGRVIPGSSEVPSESSVIASHSLPAPLCSPSRVPLWVRYQSRVLPESSEVPSVNSDPHRLPETWTALLVCGIPDPRRVPSRTRHANTLCVLSPATLCAVALLASPGVCLQVHCSTVLAFLMKVLHALVVFWP